MAEKRYKVIDDLNHEMARDMDLQTALLLIKAYCENYYNMNITLTLKEEDKNNGN